MLGQKLCVVLIFKDYYYHLELENYQEGSPNEQNFTIIMKNLAPSLPPLLTKATVYTQILVQYLSRLGINSESNSESPLKRTHREVPFSP